MADNLSLTATVREGVGKGAAREARRNDLVPGIVYGGSEDPLNINVKFNELLKTTGMNNLILAVFDNRIKSRCVGRSFTICF